MAVEIHWWGTWPREAESAVQPVLGKLYGVLPAWLKTLYVAWSDDDVENLADVSTNEPACEATLTVYPKFLSLPPDKRLLTIAHEIAHIYLARIDEAVENVLAAVLPDNGKARALADSTYATAVESVVEQIGLTLSRQAWGP